MKVPAVRAARTIIGNALKKKLETADIPAADGCRCLSENQLVLESAIRTFTFLLLAPN